jgi:bifunctional DNase/RNase
MKREVKVLALSYSNSQLSSYVCVLGEVNGNRKLPIIVKPTDAQTIALRIEKMEPPRPLTHDLLKSVCSSFMIDCQEVYIYQAVEGIFYAKLVMNNGVDDADVETTAGDAIALSFVFDCPLYVSESIMSEFGIETDSQGNLVPDTGKKKKEKKDVISIEDLKVMMEEAISKEEYELAAKYRDRIAELQKSI